MKTALIFVGGERGDVIAADLPAAELIVAADSGLHHALDLGVTVDLVIGDMDSVDVTRIGSLPTIVHPTDKDASDFELAVDYAIEQGATDVVIVGGSGGRLDHAFALLMGMCREAWASVNVRAIMGRSRAYVVRDTLVVEGEEGQMISQFAVAGPVTNLRIEGLKWSGHYEQLQVGSSLCLSDAFVEPRCRLSIGGGVMLVIHELGERP